MIFSSVSDFVKTLIDRKSPMIQSFSIFNGNNFPESYLSKVFTLSSNLSYIAAPGTARHCYVETVTLRLARSQQNIVTERRCVMKIHGTTVCLGQGILGLEVADIQQLIVRGIWNATATD